MYPDAKAEGIDPEILEMFKEDTSRSRRGLYGINRRNYNDNPGRDTDVQDRASVVSAWEQGDGRKRRQCR